MVNYKKIAKKIKIDCCTHYKSKKYCLAHLSGTNIPFVYCEECGDFQFVGNFLQWIVFKLISFQNQYFDFVLTEIYFEIEEKESKKNE